MKKIITYLFITFSIGAYAQTSAYNVDPNPPAYIPGYKLVWSDEFNNTGKPSSEWSYETGLVRNNEDQYYQSDNANCADGALQITARKERVKNAKYVAGSTEWNKKNEYAEYTSASIHTRGKKSWKYGRFEIRAKIPAIAGCWPAIWTLGDWGDWPSNGEIDIMEYYGEGIMANAAWGTSQAWTAKWDSSKTPMSHFTGKDSDWRNKYHIWVMDWTPEFIKLYVDGELLNTIETAKTFNADGSNPFTSRNHYVLLNLALGGDNGGNPANPNYPVTYYVDYVRVYQIDAAYESCFQQLDKDNNLAPDPTCSKTNPFGSGSRTYCKNTTKVYCGNYCGEITGGTYGQRINFQSNKTYRIRAMVYPNGDDVVLGVSGIGEEHLHRIEYGLYQWNQVDFIFNTPETVSTIGTVYLGGASGSLIDNLEVYEVNEPFINVSAEKLLFNMSDSVKTFHITGNSLTGNLTLQAPACIELSKTSVTPEEVKNGVTIKATFNKTTSLSSGSITMSGSGYSESIQVSASLKETPENVANAWDGNGKTGAGSEPNRFGWLPSNAGWALANQGGIRYQDRTTPGAAENYTYNGVEWLGRLLHLRWESGITPGNCFAFPVNLKANTTYTFSCMVGWHSNGGENDYVYTVGVNSAADNSGVSLARMHCSINKASQLKLYDILLVFTPSQDGTYYLTFDNTGGIMGAVADINVREGIFLPAELTVNPLRLTFNENIQSTTFRVFGKYVYDDVELIPPAGITLSRSLLPADEVSAETTVTATCDGSREIKDEYIEVKIGNIVKTLPVSATSFEVTSVNVPDINRLFNIYNLEKSIMIDLNPEYSTPVNMKVYSLQGILLKEIADKYSTGNKLINIPMESSGMYLVKITTNKDEIVKKVILK